jgi:hypothetical protein
LGNSEGTTGEDVGRPELWGEDRYQKPGQSVDESVRTPPDHPTRISAPPLPSLGRITNSLRPLRRRRIKPNCPGVTLVDIAGTDAIRTCLPNGRLLAYTLRRPAADLHWRIVAYEFTRTIGTPGQFHGETRIATYQITKSAG